VCSHRSAEFLRTLLERSLDGAVNESRSEAVGKVDLQTGFSIEEALGYLDGRVRQMFDRHTSKTARWTRQDAHAVKTLVRALNRLAA
jgi:hypothetical protein